MRCRHCKRKAVREDPRLCSTHFISYYEKKVHRFFNSQRFLKGTSILVGLSGGKDSTALAHVLSRMQERFTLTLALVFIDVRIPGCTEHWRASAEELAGRLNLPLHCVDLQDYPFRPSESETNTCSACGTIKRYLLNRTAYERGFDYLATGHNLDDSYYFLMHSLHEQRVDDLLKYDKRSPPDPQHRMAGRLKPLIYLSEEENRLYTQLKELPVSGASCPYSDYSRQHSFKLQHQDVSRQKKYNFVKSLRRFKYGLIRTLPIEDIQKMKGQYTPPANTYYACESCGHLTSRQGRCRFCRLMGYEPSD